MAELYWFAALTIGPGLLVILGDIILEYVDGR